MEENRNISQFMQKLLNNYKGIRGKKKDSGKEPFWDVVVITTIDNNQKKAYEMQIKEKLSRNELPIDLPIIVVADPPGPKIGNGGSTLTTLKILFTKYGDRLFKLKIMVIHAGGWSQRLPSASVLGKIFTAVPYGEPVYQMLDIKLALYWPFVNRMKAGIFNVCADDILVYNLGTDCDWSISEFGFTALAHPSPMKLGNKHGVYVVNRNHMNFSKHVIEAECLQVLQKPTDKQMEDAGAIIAESGVHCFADGLTIEGRAVYTDSSFFFGADVVKKLLDLITELGVLTCEIDAYGDFLQALGSRANEKYINVTTNISEMTHNLTECRLKVFHRLKGTDINLIILNASKFIHIGTTKEYIHYFCENITFKNQMSFDADVFNNWIDTSANNSDHIKRQKLETKVVKSSCIMHSTLQNCSVINSNTVVEYCHFEIPVEIGSNSIISNCQVLSNTSAHSCLINIPSNIFMHTVPICTETMSKYVTLFFNIDDDLKKSETNFMNLTFMDSDLATLSNKLGISTFVVSTNGTGNCSLWNVKLFVAEDTMSKSFQTSLKMIDCIKNKSRYNLLTQTTSLFSFSDLLKYKDVDSMINYRESLYKLIQKSA